MFEISILGCGWLGLPLGTSLVKKGYKVKGSTTKMSKLSEIRATDMTPFLINLEPEFKGEGHFLDSDVLILTLPPRNTPTDVDFYKKQLQAVKNQAEKSAIEKVIFISSTAVYPNLNKEVVESDASYKCLSRSGISLLEMEDIFRNSNLETTIIRFGGLYGPERHPGRFLLGKSHLPGGSNPVNMIHLDDCIGVIDEILSKNLWGETYNACSPNHPDRKSFYSQASRELGLPSPVFEKDEMPFKIVSSQKFLLHTEYSFLH